MINKNRIPLKVFLAIHASSSEIRFLSINELNKLTKAYDTFIDICYYNRDLLNILAPVENNKHIE